MNKVESFTIRGRLPGLNEYTLACRSHRMAGARLKKEAQTICEYALVGLKRKGVHFERVDVDITWYEKNKRRDKDNISFGKKFILDSLQSMGIIGNDGWSQIGATTERHKVDKDHPRIEVVLTESEEEA